MPKDDDDLSDIPRERKEPRPDFGKMPVQDKKLPASIQATLDDEEKLWAALYEGHTRESTESNIRYAAYASRVRTILLSAHRYVAYTSDVGESFRPVAHPYLVKAAYGVSWAYLAGDVAHEGYKAYLRNQRARTAAVDDAQMTLPPPMLDDYRTVMAQRAVFQGIASMGLPAVTIHSTVKYSGRALRHHKNPKIRTWGPIGLGLFVVPFLPYVFDEPIERAVEWTFHNTLRMLYGQQAVAGMPATGQKELRHAQSTAGAKKEKEL